jgi:hypothetical protein
MESLEIPHEWDLLPDVGHDVRQMYQALGVRTEKFYSSAFAGAG